MHDWKQAARLAKIELGASKKSFISLFAFLLLMGFIFINAFDVYLEGEFFLFDFMFLLVFLVFPAWLKGKEFQMAKQSGDLWTVPAIIMLQQLPITKEVIVKSRFIIYGVHSFSLQLLLLAALPIVSSGFRELMTPLTFSVFVLIWLSLSFAFGFVMAASEAGGLFDTKAFIFSWLWVVLAIVAMYFLFPVLFPDGFLMWTIWLAGKWPLPASIAAIVLGFAGWRYWQYQMKRNMEKTDYL